MQFYDVAQILTTHGLTGEVKVKIITDFPDERFASGTKLALKDDHECELSVTSSRPFKQFWLVQFEEVTSIEEAEKLRGKTLVVAEIDQQELPAGTYYYRDILDSTVLDFATNEELGKVTDIQSLGPNDVWQITEKSGHEYLIPYITDVVKKIDVANKRIYVTLMEGLRDEN
ncbi:ribosome maturation factor RimM [Lactobacillus sp. ESL0791]|uniref:ribosome maturation factor RimM n=1 Tax=Lactobacillus sp. ESL0791 TaxID=2983234 RepID=UPI0023F8F6E3|nr:ribosome maturation factor RimM [Lactobacillus sp. ESL0791]MDF7639102.1 ribosome maturation factor RimM [Lactobacillus sp. ESL0791]